MFSSFRTTSRSRKAQCSNDRVGDKESLCQMTQDQLYDEVLRRIEVCKSCGLSIKEIKDALVDAGVIEKP